MPSPMDAVLSTCSIEPVWFVWAELSNNTDSDNRVREAVSEAIGLDYGAGYDRVSLETGGATQFCRPVEGSFDGPMDDLVEVPARILTFSIPRDPEILANAIETIQRMHSYEEPVIYIKEAFATRADYAKSSANPNRMWNRGGQD